MDLFVYVYSWNALAICSNLNLSPDPVNERVHASSSGSGVKSGSSLLGQEIMINKTLSQMNSERLSPRKKKKATSPKPQAASALKKTQLNSKIKK